MKIFSNFSFSLTGFIYLIIAGVLCHILPFPEIVKGFLALPAFLIIPYLIGNIFVPSNFFTDNAWHSKVSREIISWMVGLILLVLGAIIFVKIFSILYYILIVFMLIGIKTFIFNKNQGLRGNKIETMKIIKRNYKEIIILVLIISLPLILTKGFSPFPLNYVVDPFHFSLAAHRIMDHSVITQGMAYFPFLEIIVAIISIIYNLNPFTLFWTGPFFSYSVFTFGIYLLIYLLSKNKKISLIAALFAIFPALYRTTWAMFLYMFIPQIWIYFVFPFCIFIIHTMLQQNTEQISIKSLIRLALILLVIFLLTYEFTMYIIPSADDPLIRSLFFIPFCLILAIVLRLFFNTKTSITLCTIFGFLIMLHFPMSAVAIALLLAYIFLYFLSKYSIKYYHFVAYALIFCLTIAIFFQIPDHIKPPEKYYIYIFTYSFSQKIDLIKSSFTYLTILFFIIGAIYILLTRSPHTVSLSFLLVSMMALFIYFVDVPELVRAAGFFAIFGIYIIVQGFLFVNKYVNQIIVDNTKKFIVLALLFIIAIPIIFDPMLGFMKSHASVSAEESSVSTFRYADYKAALWIKDNVPNALIITDRWTSVVLGGISGAHAIRSYDEQSNLAQSIKKIIVTSKPDEAYNIITLILSQNISSDTANIKKDDVFQPRDIILFRIYNFEMNLSKKDVIIVITPFTIGCVKGDIQCRWWNVWYGVNKQLDETDPSIKKFFDSKFFELIYKDDNKVYIFKYNRRNELTK